MDRPANACAQQRIQKLEQKIIELEKANAALRLSNMRYRKLFHGSPDAIAITQMSDGTLVDVNRTFEKMFSIPRKEAIGQTTVDLGIWPDPTVREHIVACMKAGNSIQSLEHKHRRASGDLFDVSSSAELVELEGKTYFLAHVRDITRQKSAEKALRKSESKYKQLIQTASDAIYLMSETGAFIDANPAACSMLDRTKEELLQSDVNGIDPNFNLEAFFDFWKEHPFNEPVILETSHLHKDGSLIPVEVSAQKFMIDDKVYYFGIARDITDRKQAEEELKQAHKMEAIGTLAGGIAHDFNNILASIMGFTELSLDDVTPNTRIEDNLHEVMTAGKRAKDLVTQILTFARQTEDKLKPIQIDTIVKEVLKLIRSSTPSNIQMVHHIETQALIISNPTQVHQVLMNLCSNAIHAMEDAGGILEVRLKDVTIGDTPPPSLAVLKAGDYVELVISDTGTGIPDDIMASIFDPYFSTKEPDKGTGMGLAVVKSIIERDHGAITVESNAGKGTAFSVYLPTTTKQIAAQRYQSENLPAGSESILFVDDEAPLVKIGSRSLEKLGYSVTTRTSSLEALALFRSKPNAFDLVITDMTMPNMTGDLLASELMAIRPDIPVILCTGYSKKISDASVQELGVKALVYKPIIKADLAKTIRKVLDASTRTS